MGLLVDPKPGGCITTGNRRDNHLSADSSRIDPKAILKYIL